MASPATFACDLCAIYTSFSARDLRPGWIAGLFEQYTDFGTVQDDGREVDDPADQSLRSSITQLFVGYQWNRRFGVQLNAPWIDRSFRRAAEGGIERGDESGFGDVALVAHWQAFERVNGRSTLRLILVGGIELPTGDSDRLADELAEGHVHEVGHQQPLTSVALGHEDHEHGEASAVHGHDLALGSGSTDFLVGARLSGTAARLFLDASVQYALRRTGDFDYRFANDLQASLAVGAFAILGHDHTLALGVQAAAERKGKDRLAGEPLADTGFESLFAGPLVRGSRGDRWFGELAVDLPVSIDNTALQIVPDWRARVALTHRW
jgi:hypothetical protein